MMWQPIESAPKDGSMMLISVGHRGGVGEAWFSPSYTKWYWASGDAVQLTPTHWMPLPLPPAVAETDAVAQGECQPPAVFADPTRIALDHALMALKAMLVAVKNEPAMQGRKYVTLGIQVNDAIDKCHAAMLSSSPSMRGGGKK